MKWFRTSRLWRGIFRRWTARAREQLRLRREAAAVVAMEERRKRYQDDAQQRLAWVDEGLAQQYLEDRNCPVCCADAGALAWASFDSVSAAKLMLEPCCPRIFSLINFTIMYITAAVSYMYVQLCWCLPLLFEFDVLQLPYVQARRQQQEKLPRSARLRDMAVTAKMKRMMGPSQVAQIRFLPWLT